MNKFMYKFDKFYIFSLIAVVLGIMVFPFIYAGTYKLINYLDSSIFDRYATEGKFDDNLFFSAEIDEATGIIQQLYLEIEEFDEVDRVQEFANVIRLNEDVVTRIITDNKSYLEYLTGVDCDVEDVIRWSKKMASLDQTLMAASLYLVLLIIFIMMVVIFDMRALFYSIAGVVYLVATLSLLSDGISDYVVVKILSMLSDDIIYDSIEELRLIFSQVFKESALTFIIFETVIQIWRSRKNEKKEKEILYLHHSLGIQIEYLQQYNEMDKYYILRLRMPCKYILIYCNKEIHRLEKRLNKKVLADSLRKYMVVRKEQCSDLKDSLVNLRNNETEYTVREYIEILSRIQYLLHKVLLVRTE